MPLDIVEPPNKIHAVIHDDLPKEHQDPLLRGLHVLIRLAVRMLAVLMLVVIFLGVAHVMYLLVERLQETPVWLLDEDDLFALFGGFMIVLIAVEIFINIRLYLGSEVLPVQLVVATALMAIARKVIVLDLTHTEPLYVFAIGVVVLALGVTYWLVFKKA